MITASVSVDTSSMIQDVLKDWNSHLTIIFKKGVAASLSAVKEIVRQAILTSPEYVAICPGGELHHQLGIPDIKSRMDTIIEVILSNINLNVISPTVSNTTITGKVEINILKSDYSDILNLAQATLFSEGSNLNWLSWLLLKGDSPIILGYHYYPKYSKNSRTGFGIMEPTGAWEIPEEYSGTANNNWLTRATNKIGEKIPLIMEKEILSQL